MEFSAASQWELLAALYRHGADIEKLDAELPEWRQDKLQRFITRLRKRAAKRVIHVGVQQRVVNKWLHHAQNLHHLQGTSDQRKKGRRPNSYVPKDHAPLLSKVMLYAATLEDHPPPSSPSQPDYTEIYRYLSQLLAGQELTQLSPGSASKVLEVLGRVTAVLESGMKRCDLIKYFRHFKNRPAVISPKPAGATSSVPAGEEAECPLFQDHEEEEADEGDSQVMELRKDDPYYEVKKEKLLRKLQRRQEAAASSLSSVPGLNPFELPPRLLVKPAQTLLDPLHKT